MDKINSFLVHVLLSNMASDKLKEAIDFALEDAFSNGKEAKAHEIKRALGLL